MYSTHAIPLWAWVVLAVVVGVSLTADLIGHRGGHGQGRRQAAIWTVAWITVALAFAGWIAVQFGLAAVGEFATAYLVEKSLSVDNLFVFLLVFTRLQIAASEQHRVLFWGVLGALVTRGIFIASGTAMLAAWHGAVYVMGAFLVVTGIKSALERSGQEPAGEGKILRFARRHLPYTPKTHGHRFLAVEDGRRRATPLLLALVAIELTDIVFAVDSVPAVFAVSRDPFIVYSSNILAVLGLRALYVVLAGLLTRLWTLRYGLAAILVVAGAKMLTGELVHVPPWASLLVTVGILAVTLLTSLLRSPSPAT